MQINQRNWIAAPRGANHWGGLRFCKKLSLLVVMLTALAACSSVSQVGLMVAPTADPASIIKETRSFTSLGPAEATACRFFVLAIIPFGNSTAGRAMQKALSESGGDAIINAIVTTSLYGFVPIYNVLSFTCTTVRGVAIKFDRPV